MKVGAINHVFIWGKVEGNGGAGEVKGLFAGEVVGKRAGVKKGVEQVILRVSL